MRLSLSMALAACLLAATACQSATVRGTEGRSLTATAPLSLTIGRGDSVPLEIRMDRKKFSGPVSLRIFQLPRGVTADTTSLEAQTTSATFILTASLTAGLVGSHAVGITIADPDGRSVTQFVNLTVIE